MEREHVREHECKLQRALRISCGGSAPTSLAPTTALYALEIGRAHV